jgi:hypothetical protein
VAAADGIAAAKAVYDDLTEQLGATEKELAQVEQDLEDANTTASRPSRTRPPPRKRGGGRNACTATSATALRERQ